MEKTSATLKKYGHRKKRNLPVFNFMITGHRNSGKRTFLKTLFHALSFVDVEVHTSDNETSETLSKESATSNSKYWTNYYGPGEAIFVRDSDSYVFNAIAMEGYDSRETDPEQRSQWLAHVHAELDKRYSKTLSEEIRLLRNPKRPNVLVHLCLFLFDGPTLLDNKGLSETDFAVIKSLGSQMHLLSCVGRSDKLSSNEQETVREYIKSASDTLGSVMYFFPSETDGDSDSEKEETPANDSSLTLTSDEAVSAPSETFLVFSASLLDGSGSQQFETNSQGEIGRAYKFGFASCMNPQHCDLTFLLENLDVFAPLLIERTRNAFYEHWRSCRLTALSNFLGFSGAKDASSCANEQALKSLGLANASIFKPKVTLHSKGPDVLSTLDPMTTDPSKYLCDTKCAETKLKQTLISEHKMKQFIQTYDS